jgi:23S rRNA pseudouridine955/2504/2580 synthase
MNDLSKESVTWLEIDENAAGQRIDNFLLKQLKGVPKSHIYRILRSGEVRVNSGRIDATYKLQCGDRVRVPPIRLAARSKPSSPGKTQPRLQKYVIYEDDALLVINKPAGTAVHGGSGISRGVVEQLRLERPESRFLELVHRLDRETSGVLMLAKKRSALTGLHKALREGGMDKRYLALVKGQWKNGRQHVRLALHKYLTPEGERRVSVDEAGQASHTIFSLKKRWANFSLVEAELRTGRTHQIRVHLSHLGFPIAGDDKYGDFDLNRSLRREGLKRMFLHASSVEIRHPLTDELLRIEAPLPDELKKFLAHLDAGTDAAI